MNGTPTDNTRTLLALWLENEDIGPADFMRTHLDVLTSDPNALSDMLDFFYEGAIDIDIEEIAPDEYADWHIEQIEAATVSDFMFACADHYNRHAGWKTQNTLIWRLPEDGICGEMRRAFARYSEIESQEIALDIDGASDIFETAPLSPEEQQSLIENIKTMAENAPEELHADFTPGDQDLVIRLNQDMEAELFKLEEKIEALRVHLSQWKLEMRRIETQLNQEIKTAAQFYFPKKAMGSSLLGTDYRGAAENALTSNAIPHRDNAIVAMAYWHGPTTILLDETQFEYIEALKLHVPATRAPLTGRALPRETFTLLAEGALHKSPDIALSPFAAAPSRFVSIAAMRRDLFPDNAL